MTTAAPSPARDRRRWPPTATQPSTSPTRYVSDVCCWLWWCGTPPSTSPTRYMSDACCCNCCCCWLWYCMWGLVRLGESQCFKSILIESGSRRPPDSDRIEMTDNFLKVWRWDVYLYDGGGGGGVDNGHSRQPVEGEDSLSNVCPRSTLRWSGPVGGMFT